ncbi:transcription termination/antitermination factor NusG [bacterium]|nr:transcription termination/antitermination factor NusG [bacterium]
MAKKWFVLHTHSGFEHRVKAALEERIKTDGYDEIIDRIILPLEEVTEIRKGKKQIAKKKFLPGYLFIHIETDEKGEIPNDTWHMIRNIPKVTSFVGSGVKPSALADEEMKSIIDQIETGSVKPKTTVLFQRGDRVRVIDGPFLNFSGMVDEINADQETLKVMVSIFGRPTPVKLKFGQVESI